MTVNAIRQKLYEYIKVADDNKVKAIFTLLQPSNSIITDWWHDENFITELKKRDEEMESGKDVGINWNLAKSNLLEQITK